MGAEPPKHNVRSARGELENSPVDCFLRGEALQERASPLRRYIKFSAFHSGTPYIMKNSQQVKRANVLTYSK